MAQKKNILVTGATSGIGKVAAIEFAKQGHSVIIHGRNANKLADVKTEITSLIPTANVDVVIADLLKKSDIQGLAEQVNSRYDKLDVLINNAGGVMSNEHHITVDGWESTIALNVLAPFMLSALLYPIMETQSDARIVNTASMAHRSANPKLDDLMYNKKYSAIKAYGDAKLYVILMGQEFARRQRKRGSNIVMNAFHPGIVATNFAQESDSIYNFFFKAFRMFLTTPEKGADTMIYLATDPEANQFNGEYMVKRKKAKVYMTRAKNLSNKELWEYWEQCSGVSFL